MKKCTAIVLVLSLALALFACGGAAAPDPDYDAAQDFACRYITVCADCFYDPPSMQVVKAWYYKSGAMWYFTFELKVENNYHITQTVYYGNQYPFTELTDDYLGFTGRWWRWGEKDWTEAPAVVKHGGWYWLLGSSCTGWKPNAARIYRAKSLEGPWEWLGNPCTGVNPANMLGADKTWGWRENHVNDWR